MEALSVAPLLGRIDERMLLDQLAVGLREGRSGVLVVRGEAGIGKTALLEYLAGESGDSRVVRAAGVESEMELAYAGLHQFCGGMMGGLERLPGPQREALEVAFGLRGGAAPDRFMVGLAVLGLLSEAGEEEALVCLVDDAQWLDEVSSQTLAFVGRRLQAERVALVFAVRDGGDGGILAGLPELIVRGLPEVDARALLETAIPGPVDARVRDRIVAETGGNPLALIELPRGLTPEQLAGGFALPDSVPLASGIEQSFLQRLGGLAADTRRLLLVAAADPVGDVSLLWGAAARLGIGMDAADAAETAGLVEIGSRVRFRHPLVRSAVYRSVAAKERRLVHRVLADATDAVSDPDRRAWHRAHAAAGPDDAVAAELEGSAARARARGGAAASAAFLERAASLTPDAIVAFATYASAVLYNGIGRYALARDAAQRVIEHDVIGYGSLVISELAEAASRAGDADLLERALAWIRERAVATPTAWATGIAARIEALASTGDDADRLYRGSLDRLGGTRLKAELGRGHLLYGEWLRREGRRVDAREQLVIAHELLVAMGLEGFAQRAAHELQATGATPRKRVATTRDHLTTQERRIARLAGEGLSNPEIAAQLFLSTKTVEFHLRKVFAKLGISSRVQLPTALGAAGEDAKLI